MNFFRRVREKILPVTIDDPLFGRLKSWKNFGLWFGRVHFRPIDCDIDFQIPADENGPQEYQRQFFRELDTKYHELLPIFELALTDEYGRWMKKPLPTNIWNEFSVWVLDLPEKDTTPREWSITFSSKSIDGQFTIFMNDWAIVETIFY
jgi:hypothetical protein